MFFIILSVVQIENILQVNYNMILLPYTFLIFFINSNYIKSFSKKKYFIPTVLFLKLLKDNAFLNENLFYQITT